MLPVENAYSRVEQAVAHKASPDTLSKQMKIIVLKQIWILDQGFFL